MVTTIQRTARSSPQATPECVESAQTGDSAAFGELVRLHEHGVYSFVLGLVRNSDDASDLTQEVWLRVAKNLPQLRETSRFTPWLYRIARNCCMDFFEARKSRPHNANPTFREDEDEEQ